MKRVAISGHRGLTAEVTRYVDEGLRATLAQIDGSLVGFSCLADGADQLFAQVVLDLGGSLEVVVPATEYRENLPDDAKPLYDTLFARAVRVHQMQAVESDGSAHQAASEFMVDQVELLVAVWDGKPAKSYGGTADVVTYARGKDVPVVVIWPDGVTRD